MSRRREVNRVPVTTTRPEPATRQLVVGSVPAGHVYVRHLGHPDGPQHDAVRRLPDPHPDLPGRIADGRWWPPRMLDPEWIAHHRMDVLHVHFGYDDRSPAELQETVTALRRAGVPLVLTLHDLRNPHHETDELLPRQLDVLVPAAAAVITLTPGAETEIARRWGVAADVLTHPHVVPLADLTRLRRREPTGRRRVGVSAKSLRRNTDPLRLLPGLLAAADAGVEVVVDLHHDVYDAPPTPYAARLRAALDAATAAGRLSCWVHDRLTDEQLWTHLSGLDAVVLPYRFGTHSGWLEAAHDLGLRVVAPTLGQYAGQGADQLYAADETGVDQGSLTGAVLAAVDGRPDAPGDHTTRRRAQRIALAHAHERIYRRVLEAR